MNDYVKTIRQKIGHDPLLLCGASVILVDQEGRLLLQKRADNHLWGYSGGAVELGETVEVAAKRELFEETGLVAEELTLLGVFSGEEAHHYFYPNQDEVYIIDHCFLCQKYHGTLCADPAEVEELQFFAWEDLPCEVTPACIPGLKAYGGRV